MLTVARRGRAQIRVSGEELVGCAPGTAVGVVIVDHDQGPWREMRVDALETQSDRVVPIAVDVREGDRFGGLQCVLEETAMELHALAIDRDPERAESRDDLR